MKASDEVTSFSVREWRAQWARLSLVEKDRYQPFGVGGEDEYLAERIREVLDYHCPLDPVEAMQPYRQ